MLREQRKAAATITPGTFPEPPELEKLRRAERMIANVKATYPKKVPKLVAGRRGWHIMDSAGNPVGKLIRLREKDDFILVIRGKAAMQEVFASGILSQALNE